MIPALQQRTCLEVPHRLVQRENTSRSHRHRWAALQARCTAERPATPMPDRRRLLAATLLGVPLSLAVTTEAPAAAAAEATAAADVALGETFMSTEGFAFSYPSDWVVAFDRSGNVRGNGAVAVVGNFRSFDTVSVFRTQIDPAQAASGLTEDLGYQLAIAPQEQEASTMRFKVLRSELVQGSGSCGSYFDYEYTIEICRGEIIEGSGGKIECLGPQGQDLQTLRRHHVGRALVVRNNLYALNASAPVDRWEEVGTRLAAVVKTFRC